MLMISPATGGSTSASMLMMREAPSSSSRKNSVIHSRRPFRPGIDISFCEARRHSPLFHSG